MENIAEAKRVSFEDAENEDVLFYASQTWQESGNLVEKMRKAIWRKAYQKGMEKIVRVAKLKDDRDDFE